jgi:hypothetical protein
VNLRTSSRRRFLALGLSAGAAFSGGLAAGGSSAKEVVPGPLSRGIDLEKWNRIKGTPYRLGSFGTMPGVCRLPGPQAKRNWPDRNKYKDVETIPAP